MAGDNNGGNGSALKAVHDSIDEIPEPYRDLYAERNGKYELSGIVGVKTEADVARIQEALRKEKEDHKRAKEAARVWLDSGWKFEDIQARMDKWEEMELAAQAGKMDEDKLNQLVETRIKSRIAPVEREKSQYAEQLKELSSKLTEYQQRETQRTIYDSVDSAIEAAKIIPSAREDVRLLAERMFEVNEDGKVVTKDGVGVTPGVAADIWLQEMMPKRPHWWPESQGGGAKGAKAGMSVARNPWSASHWNVTEQARYIQEHGMEKAQQLAALAGSIVGATKPAAAKAA